MAGCHHRSPEARIEYMSDKIASKLDFTQEQKAKLNAITADLKKDVAEEKARRQAMRGEVEQLILADTLDQKKVKSLIKAHHERMDAKVDVYLSKVADLHQSLKPEQKKELIEWMDKFHRHWD